MNPGTAGENRASWNAIWQSEFEVNMFLAVALHKSVLCFPIVYYFPGSSGAFGDDILLHIFTH